MGDRFAPACPDSAFSDFADIRDRLLTPVYREADLRDLDKLKELRKQHAVEAKFFSDPGNPLSKKAQQLGFRKSS